MVVVVVVVVVLVVGATVVVVAVLVVGATVSVVAVLVPSVQTMSNRSEQLEPSCTGRTLQTMPEPTLTLTSPCSHHISW